jgi:predicted acylesterase/phospholipase RssA
MAADRGLNLLRGWHDRRKRSDRLDRAKKVSLAPQGGGSHGAFAWGVLDYLLEDARLDIEAITGTSAGAINAVVLAEGYLERDDIRFVHILRL